MRYQLTLPARINLLGNPSDGNEGDFATISAAIDIYAGATLEPAIGLALEMRSGRAVEDTITSLHLDAGEIRLPLPYTGELDLIKGAINRLYSYSAEFRDRFISAGGVHITIWSDVPRQSGLGGSTLFVQLVLAGLREFYDLDRSKLNDYVLAELTQRVEAKELGIACGFADRYVPLFGGIAYLDYRGKLHQQPVGEEPFVTYERLDEWIEDLPLVAITTGIEHDSGEVHGRMRPRYISEYNTWVAQGGKMPEMVRFMRTAWETAWRGKIALLEGDLERFGELMNQNHRIVDEMMAACGFPDGAGWANNLFIQAALEHGALGAKLTGAGSGGSVFALTRPGEEPMLAEVWEQLARREGLAAAHIFRPRIARHGLRIISD